MAYKKTLFASLAVLALAIGSPLILRGANLGSVYNGLTAEQKLEQVWNKVNTGGAGSFPSTLTLAGIFLEDMWPTFDHSSDEMPAGRQKLIHSVGPVAKVSLAWTPAAYKYTGVFEKDGGKHALIRLSSAAAPAHAGFFSDNAMTPGISLKIFRDNAPSANTFAMWSLLGISGEDGFNFFKHPMANSVSGANLSLKLKALQKKFQCVSMYAGQMGLSSWANIDHAGQEVSEPKFPFVLVFVPNPRISKDWTGIQESDLNKSAVDYFQGNEILFKVYAASDPDTELELIGLVTLKSQFVTSKYGDEHLFFQHTKYDDDLALRPDWTPKFDMDNQGLEGHWKGKVPAWDADETA